MGRRKKIKRLQRELRKCGNQYTYQKNKESKEYKKPAKNILKNNEIKLKKEVERMSSIPYKSKTNKIIGGVYIMKTPFTENNISVEGIRKIRPVIVYKKITIFGEHKSNNYLCIPLSTKMDNGVKFLLDSVLQSVPVHMMVSLFDEDLTNNLLHIIPEKRMKLIRRAVDIHLDDTLTDKEKESKLREIPLYYETDFGVIMNEIIKEIQDNYISFKEKRTGKVDKNFQPITYNVNITNNTYNIQNNQKCNLNIKDSNDINILNILDKYPERFKNGMIKLSKEYNQVPELTYQEVMNIFGIARSSAYKYMNYMDEVRDILSLE